MKPARARPRHPAGHRPGQERSGAAARRRAMRGPHGGVCCRGGNGSVVNGCRRRAAVYPGSTGGFATSCSYRCPKLPENRQAVRKHEDGGDERNGSANVATSRMHVLAPRPTAWAAVFSNARTGSGAPAAAARPPFRRSEARCGGAPRDLRLNWTACPRAGPYRGEVSAEQRLAVEVEDHPVNMPAG